MKYTWFVVSLLLLLMVGAALAQQPTFNFKVPFAFVVGRQTFSPGSYTLQEKGPNMFLLLGDSATAFISVTSDGGPNPSWDGKLRFRNNDGTYVLFEVSGAGERWEVPVWRSKVTVAKNAAPVEVPASGSN